MQLTDAALTELVRQSAPAQTDTFFCLPALPAIEEIARFCAELRERAFVFLPGGGFPGAGEGWRAVTDPLLPLPDAPALLADIRLLAHPDAPALLERGKIGECLLLFPECADPAVYGYRSSYRYLAELRAALPFSLHITGVTVNEALTDRMLRAFGTRAYSQVGLPAAAAVTRVKAPDERGARNLAAAECEKQAALRTLLFCGTRAAAQSAAGALRSRGVSCALFHGGRTQAQNASALASFVWGGANVLIGTKALFPVFPFLRTDRTLYLGLPFSCAHARSLALLSPNRELRCVYCEDDVRLNVRLIDGFAQRALLPEYPQAVPQRLRAFLDLLAAFRGGDTAEI